MAKKEDRKKQKKRLKEQKKADRNDRIASARARASLYPRIVLRPDGGAPAFVATVQQLANEFDFESPACCQERHRIIFKMFRAVGIREMLRRMDISSREAPQAGFEPQLVEATIIDPLMLHVGKWIFARLPDEYRKSPLPFHYFTVVPRGNDLHVLFRFLPTVSTEHGTVYFAPAGPKVAFGGGQWKVGFFRHAIERVCERLCPVEDIGYAHFNVCEIYFRNCIYYEPLELPDGQHAIRLFKDCDPAGPGDGDPYITKVLGLDRSPRGRTRLYRTLGYCPIAFAGPRAVAKTFLFPGFRNTPEDHLVRTTSMPADQRRMLLDIASDNTARKVREAEGLTAIKWYHDNGVPQVYEMKRRVFAFESVSTGQVGEG
jgi:hypothetical protein